MRLDRKGFVRMGRLLILTLLISGCNEEQRIKWEVNKQIRRLKSKIAICFAVGRHFDSGGGMTRSSSSDSSRSINTLTLGLPGTITDSSSSSRTSSLRSACRLSWSGPWHSKQLSARMGRTSRLKSISAAMAASSHMTTSRTTGRCHRVTALITGLNEVMGFICIRKVGSRPPIDGRRSHDRWGLCPALSCRSSPCSPRRHGNRSNALRETVRWDWRGGRWFEKPWVFLCEFQARDGPRAQGSPAPYNQWTYQNWYEELEVRPWRLPQIPKQYHIFFITSKYHFIMFSFVLGPHFSFPSNSCRGR